MDMRHVRIDATVAGRVEVVAAAEDSVPVDHVTDTWMSQNGVQNGDLIQAVYVQIDSMDYPAVVWVVVTRSGLVLCVADPPVGTPLPGWPTVVNFIPKAPQR